MANEIIDFLKEQIENFGPVKHQMDIGRRYFLQENDILERKKMRGITVGEGEDMSFANVEDTTRANHKLPSGFVKLQVMQKVNYSLNDNLTVTSDEEIYDEIIPDWKKKLKQTALMASQKIYEGWQPYIENNELKFKRIPGDQLMVNFETNSKDEEKQIIRHYKVDGIEKAEIWDKNNVTILEKYKSKWKLLGTRPHILNQRVDSNGNVISENQDNWSVIPLVLLYNNDELQTDAKPIKAFVDVYDITNSDFANNIDDFQEILAVLKGYGGDDPARVLNQMKKMGALPIPEDGDVDYKQGIIPTEARQVALKQLRKDIFDSGMAVDVDNIATGKVTNNTIAAMYENLNMKASQFEQELQDFWRKLNVIINRYFEITNNPTRVSGELVFDRTMLVNQNEKAEENKLKVETLAMLSSMVDVDLLANMITNLEFIKEHSDLSEEEIVQSVINKSENFMIEE